MSQGLARQQHAAGAETDIQHLQSLLKDALDLVDRLRAPAEIGARLQEIINRAPISAGARLQEIIDAVSDFARSKSADPEK